MLSRNILYYGVNQPPPERLPLRAGPLSLIYENGDLRTIRLGEREVIRRIYAAVRDRNWGTILPQLSAVRLDIGEQRFHIRYRAQHRQGDIHFVWQADISGDERGTLRFSLDGEALSTFWRNRIGFCVLHPIRECAGAAARITHTDGSVEHSALPQAVAPQHIGANGRPVPHGAFHSMQALAHQVTDTLWAGLRFSGDVFELEDQRNWIDGSYKTYCTPLALPFPVEITAGTRIQQAVELTLEGTPPAVVHVGDEPVRILPVDKPAVPLPPLGFGLASHGQPLTDVEIERLRAAAPSHLRLELTPSRPGWQETLRQASAEAVALGCPLEIALFLSDDGAAELAELAHQVAEIRPPVGAWMILHTGHMSTPAAWIRLARASLLPLAPFAWFGAGSQANFAELNRAPTDPALVDFISFTANPQVHAFDNASIAETPATLASVLATGAGFSRGKPLAISPLTLRPLFNPVATGAETSHPDTLPPSVDPRQVSLFAAAWTLACIKYAAESGICHHLTCFETTGWRGLLETEAGPPLPNLFRSQPGWIFPVYHVFARLARWRGGEVVLLASSDPLRADALLVRRGGSACLILANLSDQPQTVTLPAPIAQATVYRLDETAVQAALHDSAGLSAYTHDHLARVELLPYALVWIEYPDAEPV